MPVFNKALFLNILRMASFSGKVKNRHMDMRAMPSLGGRLMANLIYGVFLLIIANFSASHKTF